jgi:hypothetical protein
MQITIGSDILCHGADRAVGKHCGPLGTTEFDPAAQMQPGEFLRATVIKAFDRGNIRHQIAFRISRLFTDPDDAFLWALTYPSTVTRSGTVTFISGASSVTMADSVLDPPKCTTIGVSVEVSYRLTGGAIAEV